MKIVHLLIGALVSLSCTNSTQNTPSAAIAPQQSAGIPSIEGQSSDSSKWTDNFLILKEAISAGNKNVVKSFIDFPIKNKGNEIWYLCDSKLLMEISPKEIKPFTEVDFDQYFSSVFAQDLRKTFERLNVEEFFKTHKSTSPEIEVVKGSKSKLEVRFDKSKHKLILALETMFTEQANSKFTIYYKFDVLNNQNIKFAEVHVE